MHGAGSVPALQYEFMTRCVVLAAVAVLILALQPVPTDARPGQRSAAGGQPRSAAPATPRTTSGMRFVPPQQPAVPPSSGMRSVGFPAWWNWDLVVPAPFRLSAYGAFPTGPLGGVQLDVQPWRAQVYVDGAYAGEVQEFSGYYRHLPLTIGPHVVTVVADGYEPLVLEVFVSPGQTLTYRGSLAYAPR